MYPITGVCGLSINMGGLPPPPQPPAPLLLTPVHTLIFKYLHTCSCAHSGVQCLLQKRGLNSSSPNKWSFPGGRLENPGDLDEDGDVGTRRELEEECGGGEPLGLPSLIHIECYKSGKVKDIGFLICTEDFF